MLEQKADPFAAGNAHVGLARLARAVHDAPHDRNGNWFLDMGQTFFDFLRKTDDIDLGPAAGGAGNDVHPPLADFEGFQDFIGNAHFLDRVGGERDAHRISDALGKQDAEPDARLDRTGKKRACLGNADVERII